MTKINGKVDLHVHSNRSDGTFSPSQLVDYSLEKGLTAFALTDHDTIDGLPEAFERAGELRRQGLPAPEIIPGIEFSTEYQGRDIHIVGLFIDYKAPSFQARLQAFVDSRIARNHKMCGLLQDAGIDITYEKLTEEFPGAVITRAHYARFLLNHGYIKSIAEAFDRYIGDNCPCYVPREKVTPAQAVKLILDADGVPVLAHPILYHMSDRRLEALVSELKEAGLLAIEAIYSTYNAGEERQIRSLAAKKRLLVSGGSDFHGSNKPGIDLGCGFGRLFIPETVLSDLKNCRKNLLFSDMDGTLLNNQSGLSPAMKEALDRMCESGHRLILTSGRPLPSILEVRSQLGLTYPNMLVIANNGALIYDCDTCKPILEQRLSPEDIRYLVEEAEKMQLHIHAYTDSHIVCHGMNEELRYYTRRIHLPLLTVRDIPSALENPSYKLQVIHLTDRGRLEAYREKVAPHCSGRVQMIFSNDQYLELLPAAAGKGRALSFVRDYLPAPASHTFAAGDAENDISMFEAARTAIAMANASDAVKAHANLITQKDNNNDGLLEILHEYFQ